METEAMRARGSVVAMVNAVQSKSGSRRQGGKRNRQGDQRFQQRTRQFAASHHCDGIVTLDSSGFSVVEKCPFPYRLSNCK
jgi:hypothetical protein